MTNKTKQIISVILNLSIVIMEVVALTISFSDHGLRSFQFYTEDSNMFALAACSIFSVATFVGMKKGSQQPAMWVRMLKYMATCCLTVTFIVVITVLVPMGGDGAAKNLLLNGSMLFHHLLCPILAMVSFLFFEPLPVLEFRHAAVALIPTIIYAATAIILNAVYVMEGPYPFLHIHKQSLVMSVIWCVVIVGGALLIAWLLGKLNKKLSKTEK